MELYDLEMIQRLTPFMQEHGITLVTESTDPDHPYQWNGNQMRVCFEREYGAEILVHEINHFICAKPEFRFMPEYNLGTGPESFKSPGTSRSIAESSAEEFAVCILDILTLVHWELEWSHWSEYTNMCDDFALVTLEEHLEHHKSSVNWLKKVGIITNALIPTFIPRKLNVEAIEYKK